MSDSRKRLYRSDDRVISGVLGGFADYFNVEPTIFRLAMVFLVVATGVVPGVITYIVAVMIMPDHPPADALKPEESSDSPGE